MSQRQGLVAISYQQITVRGECSVRVCASVRVSQFVTWVDYGFHGAPSLRLWFTGEQSGGALAGTRRQCTVMEFNERVWCCHKLLSNSFWIVLWIKNQLCVWCVCLMCVSSPHSVSMIPSSPQHCVHSCSGKCLAQCIRRWLDVQFENQGIFSSITLNPSSEWLPAYREWDTEYSVLNVTAQWL